jgi:ATP/maltotriose-dependent transcriptional regulator MalT
MELGSRCIELSNEYGISFFGKEASTFVAACTVIRGDVKQGLELLEETITTRPQIARQGFNIHVATMAEICLKTGDYKLALDALERSFQLYSKTKDHFFRSETFRTKGDLLFAKDGDAHIKEIESCYKYSLEISRSQSAKSLELRTTMSMAKLKKSMGKMSEALNLILPVYSWFTEGLETRDLAEARALINELSITWSQN